MAECGSTDRMSGERPRRRCGAVQYLGAVVDEERAVFTITVIIGSLMYVVEGPQSGFFNIPIGIYWSIVTLTTVGFGDVVPHTAAGKILASLVMIMGYGIIAVPTGIVTVELAEAARRKPISTQACPTCSAEGHDSDAAYCRVCGARL